MNIKPSLASVSVIHGDFMQCVAMLPESHLTPTAQHNVTLLILLSSPFHHLRQGGYVCASVHLFVGLCVGWLVGWFVSRIKPKLLNGFGSDSESRPRTDPINFGMDPELEGKIKEFLLTFFNIQDGVFFNIFVNFLGNNDWILVSKNSSIFSRLISMSEYNWIWKICIEQI